MTTNSKKIKKIASDYGDLLLEYTEDKESQVCVETSPDGRCSLNQTLKRKQEYPDREKSKRKKTRRKEKITETTDPQLKEGKYYSIYI